MKAFTITTLMVVGSIASALPASAQGEAAVPPGPASSHAAASPRVKITPFVSSDSRGSTPVGAAITFPLGSKFSLEAEVGYRRQGRLNLLNSNASLLYDLPSLGRTTPYLAAGAGLADTAVPIVTADGSVVGAPRVALEVNAGGGVEVPITDSLGMRTDARWNQSLGKERAEHWRISHGVSFDVGRR